MRCSVTLALTTQVPTKLPPSIVTNNCRRPPRTAVYDKVGSHWVGPTNTMQFTSHYATMQFTSPPSPISVLSVRPTTSQTSPIGPRKDCIVSSYYTLYPAVIRPLYSRALTFTSLPLLPYVYIYPPPPSPQPSAALRWRRL